MTLKEEGFYGLTEQFKDILYTTFVKNGGTREVNEENISRALDDLWEFHTSNEEEIVQVILFYHSLDDVLGYLPDYCYDTVNKYIEKTKAADLSNTLSVSEQNEFHAIVSELIKHMQ